MQRIFITAAHKSSGKTTLSLGLCAALNARGLSVAPYKKGPDTLIPCGYLVHRNTIAIT